LRHDTDELPHLWTSEELDTIFSEVGSIRELLEQQLEQEQPGPQLHAGLLSPPNSDESAGSVPLFLTPDEFVDLLEKDQEMDNLGEAWPSELEDSRFAAMFSPSSPLDGSPSRGVSESSARGPEAQISDSSATGTLVPGDSRCARRRKTSHSGSSRTAKEKRHAPRNYARSKNMAHPNNSTLANTKRLSTLALMRRARKDKILHISKWSRRCTNCISCGRTACSQERINGEFDSCLWCIVNPPEVEGISRTTCSKRGRGAKRKETAHLNGKIICRT